MRRVAYERNDKGIQIRAWHRQILRILTPFVKKKRE